MRKIYTYAKKTEVKEGGGRLLEGGVFLGAYGIWKRNWMSESVCLDHADLNLVISHNTRQGWKPGSFCLEKVGTFLES